MALSSTLTPIRPSAPIRNRYETRVHALLDIMSADIIKAVKRQWDADEPKTVLLGADKSAAEMLRELMRRLSTLLLAMDRATVRRRDVNGYMHVEVSNISKANVCPYYGSEIPGRQEMGLQADRLTKASASGFAVNGRTC